MTWLIARVTNSSTSRSEGRARTVTGYVRRRLPWSNRALENDAGPCVPARGISLEATPGRRLVQRFAPRIAVGPARHDPRDGRPAHRRRRRGARLLHRGPALATGSRQGPAPAG